VHTVAFLCTSNVVACGNGTGPVVAYGKETHVEECFVALLIISWVLGLMRIMVMRLTCRRMLSSAEL
jgi:hypothetical protein